MAPLTLRCIGVRYSDHFIDESFFGRVPDSSIVKGGSSMKKPIMTAIAVLLISSTLAACEFPGDDRFIRRTFAPSAPVTYGKTTFPTKIESEVYSDADTGRSYTERTQYIFWQGRWTPCGKFGDSLCDTPERIEEAIKRRAEDSIREEGGGHAD